jgi:glycogen debranching enzyme
VATEEHGERRGLLPRYTLKDENTFLLADALGDIRDSGDGLYTNDTRMLSRYELEIAGGPPSLLGGGINQHNTLFTAHLTNRPLPALGEQVIPQGVIHIERNRFLCSGRLYEQLLLSSFSAEETQLPLKLSFAADFADIFEVQGRVRTARGTTLNPAVDREVIVLSYRGRDELVRTTTISFSQAPQQLTAGSASFDIHLPPNGSTELFIEVDTDVAEHAALPGPERFGLASKRLRRRVQARLDQGAQIHSSGRLFNAWIEKSHSDLALLTTPLPTGPYPYAGIPWFATQFGRDALITALQTLWINPQMSAGVLRFLASTQAVEEAAFWDAQPGKILHEMRRGEMASLREVPFGCYYGAVDSTPLFLMLAGSYERRTGDREIVDQVFPQLRAALAWIERRLDTSSTGFLDYASAADTGLVNQGWKDSRDSIFHADGTLPSGPIAVVEVQGYVYAALNSMAHLLAARGEFNEAQRLSLRAQQFRASIETRFWLPELGFYGLALDGAGRICRIRASNAGQLLFCRVPSNAHARLVTRQILTADFSSGWGIRTLAAGQPRYNPMSYHNGSVWPHDTAICAAGMAEYGSRREVVKILSDVFEAAQQFGMRLPELYCGFERVEGQGPAPYPVACLPQAWAAGAIFMLLKACLGIHIDGVRREIHIRSPVLPIGIESLSLQNLPVGDSNLHLRFHRLAGEVVVTLVDPEDSSVQVLVHMAREP